MTTSSAKKTNRWFSFRRQVRRERLALSKQMKRTLLISWLCATGGCTSRIWWLRPGPRPAELVGTWVDSTRTTATDSVGWVLGDNGSDRRFVLSVRQKPGLQTQVTRQEQSNGQWYIKGALSDTIGRTFCVWRQHKLPSCFPFRLDSLTQARGAGQRRLRIYPKGDPAGKPLYVFLERRR